MVKTFRVLIVVALLFLPNLIHSQIDQGKLGGWYMYFFNTSFKESSWGVQGDVQLRNWNIGGDLEQLLIRGGLTFQPKTANIKFTAGYGDVTSGAFGAENTVTRESRIYQEALFPVKIGSRFYTNHRIRYEQRFVQSQDFRTRFRYNLFLNVALTSKEIKRKTLYLALYNEIFINGERRIGDGKTVEIFDRNRFYAALGYVLFDKTKVQFGIMNQTTDGWKKNQLQLSVHQKF